METENPKSLSNVAIITSTPYAPPWSEGVRNLIRRIACDAIDRKIKLTVICPKSSKMITKGDYNERVLNYSIGFKWLGWISRIRYWLAATWMVNRLYPEPDVLLLVASVYSALGMRTLLLKLASRRPLVVYITGLGSPRIGYNLGLSAEKFLVGSKFLQSWFPDAGIIYPLLPVNLDTKMHGLPEKQVDSINILFLGSFEQERGVEYLLHAMKQVKEQTNKKVKLILAWNGSGADNYQNIQRLIDSLGIRSTIDLRGYVDINGIYYESDIVVIPRSSEERMAFPLRIVEAIKMKKPVIVSRICGMEELVDGIGIAVEPKNATDLAGAILKLVNNRKSNSTIHER